ncbi:MAG: sigma-70 family RNA polymerase sigma factor [Lutibacter sp.]|uniref:RNA polymerase sigma factor n=1 Tax=Lutibacter sp. TaxID=1925666 RepID=UPI0017A130DD|nr:sigma-70 family RNA polymerase sigma factor [Lutibacter sp.]MBT8316385.1 sigma-70 family RNA polymerase sigma factor [Lutibacter sp.]NNJ57245.1 sigma-70 family RNA polymerase sigma factor [Lutibacter sp.]
MKSKEEISILSDNELIVKIVKTNDTHLFAILYDRYVGVVYNKCYGFASSKEEAQDLTHDVFIKLFVKLRTFKGTAKFSTWLYSFTYNFCVNYVSRNNYKKNEKNFEGELSDDSERTDSSDESIYNMKSDTLKKALERIDPNEKMILLLKYQDDFSIKEIQEAMDIGESAVKMRLKRAKEKLISVYKNLK